MKLNADNKYYKNIYINYLKKFTYENIFVCKNYIIFY